MKRLEAKNTAVIVLDVQERLVAAMPPEALARLLRNLDVLLFAAERLGAPLLATEQYPSGLGPTVKVLAEAFARRGVVPVDKITFSALDTPRFVDLLDRARVSAAVVTGIEAHVCVFQTARQLALRGLDVYVPCDAVASRLDEHREVGLALCERAGAIRTAVETIVFDWLGAAGSEDFRVISKRLR